MKVSFGKRLAVAVLAPALLAASVAPSMARNNTGAAVAAGIIGLAVGAAVADSANRNRYIYGPPPPPAYIPPPAFSPSPNIYCYGGQRACYYGGGAYSPDWTYRVYGRG